MSYLISKRSINAKLHGGDIFKHVLMVYQNYALVHNADEPFYNLDMRHELQLAKMVNDNIQDVQDLDHVFDKHNIGAFCFDQNEEMLYMYYQGKIMYFNLGRYKMSTRKRCRVLVTNANKIISMHKHLNYLYVYSERFGSDDQIEHVYTRYILNIENSIQMTDEYVFDQSPVHHILSNDSIIYYLPNDTDTHEFSFTRTEENVYPYNEFVYYIIQPGYYITVNMDDPGMLSIYNENDQIYTIDIFETFGVQANILYVMASSQRIAAACVDMDTDEVILLSLD